MTHPRTLTAPIDGLWDDDDLEATVDATAALLAWAAIIAIGTTIGAALAWATTKALRR